MCSPAAAMGLQATGAGVNAYGAYEEGMAQGRYYDYLRESNKREASMVRAAGTREATVAQEVGAIQTKDLKSNVRQIEGQQKAVAGVNVGGGSVTTADIARDTFNKAKMDELAIRFNADSAAYKAESDAKTRAYQLETQAEEYSIAGQSARRAGRMGVTSSLLSGATQVASTKYMSDYYRPGKK